MTGTQPPPGHQSQSQSQSQTPPPTTAPITSPPSCRAHPWHPIPDAVLRSVYASDQAMYPVALPYARLRAWVDACPDLALCFFSPGQESDSGGPAAAAGAGAQVAGVVIVLPIRKGYWEDLLRGRLKEADIDSRTMFPENGGGGGTIGQGEEGPGKVEEVGLHVYHVERYDGSGLDFPGGETGGRLRFAELALREVVRRVQVRRDWRVVGISAITATPAGKRAFERLGFVLTGYRELFVVEGGGEESANGQDQVPQTRMVFQYPNDDENPVLAVDGAVISVTEMTVKYGNLPDLV
ncbi:hypothetical protein N658DRAFT_502242 [Parathielavia hyrcaniae]|uniref:Uncharacterized protein n=1 Tax=Parathielavia hyrcaniae TaxID=113614 RepID=A0AAN6PUZ5_9PEZI|nr:hypothetical protein N658DRAFT_502242 [Parathielavia hyrcaniae]